MSRSSPNAGILFDASRIEKIVEEYPDRPTIVGCRDNAYGRAGGRDLYHRSSGDHNRTAIVFVHPDNSSVKTILHDHGGTVEQAGCQRVRESRTLMGATRYSRRLTPPPLERLR